MGHSKPASRNDSSRATIGDSSVDPRFSEVSAAVVEHLPHLRAFARSLATSKDQADDLVGEAVARALAAGATELHEPQDHGFMYGRAFEDPDGHGWESMWMSPEGPAIIAEQNAAQPA